MIRFSIFFLIGFTFWGAQCFAQKITVDKKIDGEFRLVAKQSSYDTAASLLLTNNKTNESQIANYKTLGLTTISRPSIALSGLNLVSNGGAIIFSEIDAKKNCSLVIVQKVVALKKINLADNCFAEVFQLNQGFAVWHKNFTTNAQVITVYASNLRPVSRFNLPEDDTIVTSVIDSQDGYILTNQSMANSGAFQIRSINRNGSIIDSVSIAGAGAQLVSYKNKTLLTFNRGGNPYLSLLNSSLKSDWLVRITEIQKWAATGSLVADDQAIYFVGGNNDKLYVAQFNWDGAKKNEAFDSDSGLALSSHGYSLLKNKNVIKVIGVVPVRSSEKLGKSSLVFFSVLFPT